MIEKIKRSAARRNRDRGASATEYALILGFIVSALIAVLVVFGPSIARTFDRACDGVAPADTCR
jgi:Flp pilus assembly pilin Flp